VRVTVLQPRGSEARRRPASLVEVELDPAQRGAVTLPAGRPLLVLGEAGHGKTTVALHRLAHLWRMLAQSPGEMAPRVAMIVPTEGLARLVQPLLRRLGVDVPAQTFDRWAAGQARRLFRDLPRRESEAAGPLVVRLKRDPAVRAAIAELGLQPPARVDDDPDAPVRRSRARASRGDLQHIFGDRLVLEAVARTSGSITPRMIDEVLEHTRVQFSRTAEEEWSDVTDRERLVSVDQRPMDEGTAAGDAGSLDVEDYAVLFELDRVRAERLGEPPARPRLYDVVALDEAQELAPMELALIRRSLAPGGTLVVAGDADQQTDPTTAFAGWGSTMRELGCDDYEIARLDIGYRCPPAIARLARRIAGAPEAAIAETEASSRDADLSGAEPVGLTFASERELAGWLGHEASELRRLDPKASVAVVCRTPAMAQRLTVALGPVVPVRLVFDGEFLARGPVQISVVDEVKGLEFDFVVVPDATDVHYPETPAARRALYVAATRARHQLVFAAAGALSPILNGLVRY
jgi:DNA helicase II / ATP-dependent DNA helicase PcrA